MKKLTTRQIALNGVVAGLYAAITILTASFAYGNIQFRIADSLCVLVVLEPSLTVGLTLGCLISNIFSTVSALDIVIGTAGTLLGCLLAARVKKDWLVPLPVIFANAVLVGAMLAYVLTPDALVQGFFINGGEVLLGEAVVLYLLGVPLLLFFRRSGLMEKLLRGAPHGRGGGGDRSMQNRQGQTALPVLCVQPSGTAISLMINSLPCISQVSSLPQRGQRLPCGTVG